MELEFGSTVKYPLKPLRNEIKDGKLGSFTVDPQLDVNPTITLSPSTTTKCKYVKSVDRCDIHISLTHPPTGTSLRKVHRGVSRASNVTRGVMEETGGDCQWQFSAMTV